MPHQPPTTNHQPPIMNYDVIVIGAGPAGSTVSALLARAGLRVLLLEKSRFPREKVCGEFITPDCLNVFDRLGVGEKMFDAGAKVIDQWTLVAPDGRGVNVPMEWIANGHRHAIGISRARMDLILLECARGSGVEAREGFHVSPRLLSENGHENAGIFIEGKADGETVERFSAPLVIDASGRNGVFSNQIGSNQTGSNQIGSNQIGSNQIGPNRIAQRTSLLGGSRLFGCKVHLRAV